MRRFPFSPSLYPTSSQSKAVTTAKMLPNIDDFDTIIMFLDCLTCISNSVFILVSPRLLYLFFDKETAVGEEMSEIEGSSIEASWQWRKEPNQTFNVYVGSDMLWNQCIEFRPALGAAMNKPQKTLQRVVLDLFPQSLNYGVGFPYLTILTAECLSFRGVVLGLVQRTY